MKKRAQPSDLSVHGRDRAPVMLLELRMFGVERSVFRRGQDGEMRGVKPDDGKERAVVFDRAPNERLGAIHDEFGVVALQRPGDGFAVPHVPFGIDGRDLANRAEPVVETVVGWGPAVVASDIAEMPFAIMPGRVAALAEDLGQGHFFIG